MEEQTNEDKKTHMGDTRNLIGYKAPPKVSLVCATIKQELVTYWYKINIAN